MKHKLLSIVIVSVLTILSGCQLACVDGTGEIENETRKSNAFTKVTLSIDAKLIVLKGEPSVEITAQKNIADEIKTEVSGSTLRIESKKCLNAEEQIVITIHTNDIEKVDLNGSGKINFPDTFQLQNIEFDIAGSGDIDANIIAAKVSVDIAGSGNIKLAGSANKFMVDIAGSGNVEAKRLPCNETEIDINGSGDANVYVLQKLDATVNGSGNIFYKGNPKVKSSINGSGKVNSAN